MFTNRFKLLVAALLLLGFLASLSLAFDVFDKKLNAVNFLSFQALKQSNEALRQVALFPTLTPTATPTATVKFVPKTPVKAVVPTKASGT